MSLTWSINRTNERNLKQTNDWKTIYSTNLRIKKSYNKRIEYKIMKIKIQFK